MTPLDSLKIKELETQLDLRRKIILTGIRQYLHHSDDPDKLALVNHLDEVDDWVEADLLNDTDIAQLNHELAELRDIDAALSRIKRGVYGICKECGESISSERMSANITAEYCLDCQEEFEKQHGIMRNISL
ncbi:MAG: TraR/DksA family transcriptional regulator [Burkholderiales bacterium]